MACFQQLLAEISENFLFFSAAPEGSGASNVLMKPKIAPAKQIASLMAREDISVFAAVSKLQLSFTTEECEALNKSEEFQKTVRSERNKWYRDLANDPSRDKRTAIGMMVAAVQQLMLSGEFDKALDGLTKLAKLEGWLAPDGQISVFANLTSKDLEEIKQRLQNEQPNRLGTSGASDNLLN